MDSGLYSLNKGIKFNLSFAKCGGYSKEVNLKAVSYECKTCLREPAMVKISCKS